MPPDTEGLACPWRYVRNFPEGVRAVGALKYFGTRQRVSLHIMNRSAALEKLHGFLVLLGCRARFERAKVPPFTGLGIFFA